METVLGGKGILESAPWNRIDEEAASRATE